MHFKIVHAYTNILYQYHIATIPWFIKFNLPILLNAVPLWPNIIKVMMNNIQEVCWFYWDTWEKLNKYASIYVYMHLLWISFHPERGIKIYLQFCSFELELSILQQGVVFLLTIFELMLFEFVWCYFLWRYLKIHGMEIESYCKIKNFFKRP